MTTGTTIDYEALQQEAMRGVVRAALQFVVKNGLPGEHHFYISFLTHAPGVVLSKRLKEKYPHEMTIVLQHRFWDLIVSDERFEVKLTFDAIPERLVIPFKAIKVFIDPSVRYGLQFDETAVEPDKAPISTLTMDAAFDQVGEAHAEPPRQSPGQSPASANPKKPRAARKPKTEKAVAGGENEPARPRPATLAPQPQPASAARPSAPSDEAADDEGKSAEPAGGAKILSFEQFKKK